MMLDYFYGQSGELFAYFRIPKALFQDSRFRQLSTDARTLYGILLDRMSLSAKNSWVDEHGRVYIIYTVREVQESLCCAEHKAVKLFRELEQADLIERKRRGLGRPSLIYVKNFSSGLPKAQIQNCANSNSCAAESAVQVRPKSQSNKTDKNKTERNHPLNYAQSLYEKKLITYPRTDSRFLTEDMAASLPGLMSAAAGAFDVHEAVPVHAEQAINNSKVSDHHALLPTASVAQADFSALPAGELSILRLITVRLLCAVGEPHRYAETTLTTICAGKEFSAKGKVVLDEGWKGIERKMLDDLLDKKKEPAALPDVQEQSECGISGAELKEGQTSPPKHFTEDTLLHSMETASADSMPEDAERQGIGTPATRAATIEKLVQKGFLERKGDKKTKVLLPTDKGKALITVMPEEIQSADMTADWETKLLRVERGEMEPETFMTEINDMISSLVNTTEAVKGASALMKNKVIGVCPNCGNSVVEREKGWFCESNPCRFVLWKDNAFFKRLGKRMDAHVADKLLRDGRVRLKDCKSSKGKTYNATVLLSTEADGRSKFSLEFEGGR